MESVTNVWKIADFVDEVIKSYNEKNSVEESVHVNTVDKWFRELEEGKYHHVQRVADKKVYDELDLNIAVFILEMRAQKWALEAIYNIIPSKFEVREPVDGFKPSETPSINDLERILDTKLQNVTEQLAKVLNQQYIDQLQKLLPKPKSEEELKIEKQSVILEAMQKQMDLKDEAVKLWSNKSDEERMKRVGWFRREEDFIKREEFIDAYIKENISNEIEKNTKDD
ncbi:hypothetical protein [Viridibacillus arvi]|uniref:hypothetical protein n=1 Tax=Viridibacillus arvi TaxID=263475 RepID=UPI0034CD718B